jgi:hypothetical protein
LNPKEKGGVAMNTSLEVVLIPAIITGACGIVAAVITARAAPARTATVPQEQSRPVTPADTTTAVTQAQPAVTATISRSVSQAKGWAIASCICWLYGPLGLLTSLVALGIARRDTKPGSSRFVPSWVKPVIICTIIASCFALLIDAAVYDHAYQQTCGYNSFGQYVCNSG